MKKQLMVLIAGIMFSGIQSMAQPPGSFSEPIGEAQLEAPSPPSGGGDGGTNITYTNITNQNLPVCPIGPQFGTLELFEIQKITHAPLDPASLVDVVKVRAKKGKLNGVMLNNLVEVHFRLVRDSASCTGCSPEILRKMNFSLACDNFSQMAMAVGKDLMLKEDASSGSGFSGTAPTGLQSLSHSATDNAVTPPCVYVVRETADLASAIPVVAPPSQCTIQGP